MAATCIIQARLGSTRLPGKVLEPIGGKPMLAHVVERVSRARSVGKVIVAVPTTEANTRLGAQCLADGWRCYGYGGDENDVLGRYHEAAREMCAGKVIVRVTSDCPLVDPGLINAVVAAVESGDCDYAATHLEHTWPHGVDCEAFTRELLEEAHQNARPDQREHVTDYMREAAHVSRVNIRAPDGMEPYKNYRLTVDTAEDLARVRAIYAAFPAAHFITTSDALSALIGMEAN